MRRILRRYLPAEVVTGVSTVRTYARRYLAGRGAGGAASTSPVAKLRAGEGQTFFGYYDKTPFSLDGSRVLATNVPLGRYAPTGAEEMRVGYFDLDGDRTFRAFGSTFTWCWQQGCRLQWLPGAEDELVIYNRMVGHAYGAIIQSVRTGEVVRTIASPVYDVCGSGKRGLSLDFSRLQRLRPGYGYRNLEDASRGDPAPADDGVWLVDLESGERSLVFSLRHLTTVDPTPSMRGAVHYLNHLAFNPTGDRFMLLHLWVSEGQRYSRLITAGLDGSDPYVLANEGHVSHYSWKSPNELLVYSTHRESGRHYHLYRDRTPEREVVGGGDLTEDGHPSFSPDGRTILTDTYPDRYGDRRLLAYSVDDGTLGEIGRFFSPPQLRGETRCDLHPRWDRSGRWICVDSAHEGGERAMYLIPFDPASGTAGPQSR